MTMKACWIDHGQEADTAKLRAYGVNEVVVPMQDSPLANAGALDRLRDQGFGVWLFSAWNWFPGQSGAEYAQTVSEQMKRIGWMGNAKVQVDIEKGAGLTDATYVDFVLAFAARWRSIRKTRPTAWTLEGMQGGLFNGRAEAIQAIVSAGFTIIPQCYTGDMKAMAPDVVLKDLLLYGFPLDRIVSYYRGEDLPLLWDGCVWSQGRLR